MEKAASPITALRVKVIDSGLRRAAAISVADQCPKNGGMTSGDDHYRFVLT